MSKIQSVIKPIPDYLGYGASADGHIYSRWSRSCKPSLTDRWSLLKGHARKKQGGRRVYTIKTGDGTYCTLLGSRLVLAAFVGPCPPGMEACHNDGDCTNDSVENLRWDTRVANCADKTLHGTQPTGEKNPRAKLTENDVKEIRRIGYPLQQHVIRYGVDDATISRILSGKKWKHVDGEIAHGSKYSKKLTENDVREIRRIGYPCRQHEIRYGVNAPTISKILLRRIWNHVV
jgi:hypothetical protein